MALRPHKLSIALTGDEPPTEFRIFTAGAVETTKGVFTFDEASAKSVMAEYQTHGIDLMIDYDHASLASVSLDPAQAGKAAGWFNLEVRGGELWAVNVRWTPPAADALRRKEWRFMSPAFGTDKDGRVTDLMNVAITNLPATRNLQPLMAASAIALGANLDPKNVMAALDALIAGDAEKCAELLKGIIAQAAGAEAVEPPGEETPPVAPTGEMPKDVAAAEPGADPASADDKKDKPVEMAAALSSFMRLSGKSSLVDALAEAGIWRASHIELESGRQKLAQERAVLEAAERRKGCVELVTLAGRAPATVWADDKCSAPKSYLSNMPMADFRSYVADALKSAPKAAPKAPVKASASSDLPALSESELAICERTGCKPEVYAALKAQRDSVRTEGN